MVRYLIAIVIVLGLLLALTIGLMVWTHRRIDKKVGWRDD